MKTASDELVRVVLAAHLERPETDITPDKYLEGDFGITSLGLVLIGLDIEDVQGVTLPFEGLALVKTVGQLTNFVAEASTKLLAPVMMACA